MYSDDFNYSSSQKLLQGGLQQQLEKEDNRLQEVWAKVDADNNLSLDKDELRLVLVEMGWEEKEVTDEAVDEMMAVIDADGSGDVDFEEL